jgi:pyruvate formate lyase activating enzyme
MAATAQLKYEEIFRAPVAMEATKVPEAVVKAALATGDVGFLHSLVNDSTVNGPGQRVVVRTTGCMWSCQTCHNPDAWIMRKGLPVTVTKVIDELSRFRQGRNASSRGLTITGGEPLMQDRFVSKLLAAAQDMNVHTALETNGYVGDRLSNAELKTVDLVMLSVRAWDNERHRRLTGRPVQETLTFARRLAALRKPMWLRYVLVPGLTDDAEDIANIARFAADLDNVERVEVQPFDQLARFKWQQTGLRFPLEGVEAPTHEALGRAREIFRRSRLNTV